MFKKWWFWVIVILVLSNIKFAMLFAMEAMEENDYKETNIETISAESGNTETNIETISAESKNTESKNAESENANLINDRFELINGELNVLNGVIIGSLKNTTSVTYDCGIVTFNLYDADGAQIGTALDTIYNWEPGGVWKFKAPISNQDVASYKLVKVEAF